MATEDPNKIVDGPQESKDSQEPMTEEDFAKKYNLQVIRPSQVFELPENINFKALENLGVNEISAHLLVDGIVKFLNAPIIIDKYDKDHSERRGMEDKICALHENASVFFDSNKLGVNFSFNLIKLFYSFVYNFNQNDQVDKKLLEKANLIKNTREKYNQIIAGYEFKELDEKIKAVNKLDGLFKEVLEFFKSNPGDVVDKNPDQSPGII